MIDNTPSVDGETLRTVAQAICKSRTCEGISCCQWPAQRGRTQCPVKTGAYDDAARDAIAALAPPSSKAGEAIRPHLIDNNLGEITVTLNDRELRGWSYKDDAERRTKMLAAREYVEGWYDGLDATPSQPDTAVREDGAAVQMLMAQLIVSENGSSLNGAVTIPKQTLPASVYDKALFAANRLAALPPDAGEQK